MHPKDLSIADYWYDLPAEKIALHPLAERDASKLLVCRKGQISETIYRNIAAEIPSGALLVFNNTRVLNARILFYQTKRRGHRDLYP
jgi:S-adenosylmethionine:tRNA ribosyltransferase-isomerase